MPGLTAVTRSVPFCQPDGVAVFSVNAGVPISDALELAEALTACVDNLTAADAFLNQRDAHAVIQTLTEMANALIKACRPAPSGAAA